MNALSRRQMLALSGVAAVASTGLIAGVARAQDTTKRLHIGSVVPSRTGMSTVRTSINDYPGEGARDGAMLAEAQVGELANDAGITLDVVYGSSPSPESAARTAQRLIEGNEVNFLIGGVGAGQAAAIAPIAEAAKVPFFNIGDSSPTLRHGNCGRYTFHIEASAQMYLDSMVMWGAGGDQNYRKWFIAYIDSDEGRALQQAALKAITKYGQGGQVVAAAAVIPEQPVYINEVNQIAQSGADVVLILVGAVDEISFLNQMETLGVVVPTMGYPDVLTQTHDYIASSRFLAASNNPRHRFALWDQTYAANGADAFNQYYAGRYSEVTDPTAWSAYAAIKIAFQTMNAIGNFDAEAVVQYLESGATFDVLKGPGVSFRPWDHQLRQPLMLIRVDQDVVWDRTDLTSRIAIAQFEAEIPAVDATADPVARLDAIGDNAADAACTFPTPT